MSVQSQRAGGLGRLGLLAALGIGLAPITGLAAAPGPEPDPAAQVPIEQRPLVLVMTDPDALGDAVARAVETELNDVDVRLEVGHDGSWAAGLGLDDRIARAEALVRERDALGLIWIESRPDGLVVQLVVADAGMLRRPIIGLEDPAVAVETAAVIVRHLALDLLAGRPVGLTPRSVASLGHEAAVTPTPEPDTDGPPTGTDADQPATSLRPAPWLSDRGHFRVQAGYVGQTWIRERGWENGVEVDVGWRFAVGAHVGAGIGVGPAFEAELVHPGNLGVAQLRVRRYPVALLAGYQHVWDRHHLGLDVQLRVVAEVVARGVFDPAAITPQLDRPTVVVPALEPRVGLDYRVIPQLAVFAAVGVRSSLVRVDYRVAYTDELGEVVGQERPIQPRLVVPVVVLGLDMYF